MVAIVRRAALDTVVLKFRFRLTCKYDMRRVRAQHNKQPDAPMLPTGNVVRTESGTPAWVHGVGRTVVLIHGVMVDHRMWQRQVDALAPHYRVCCMDMLGHGDAPDPPGDRSLDDFVSQAIEVVRYVSDGGPVVLGGFSMGGLIAQATAIRYHGELAGIILLNTVHDRTLEESARVIARYESNVRDGVENAVASGLSRWFTDDDRTNEPDVITDTEAWIRSGDFMSKCKAHRVFVTSDGELTGRLGAISCPALVMTGGRDAGSTPVMTSKLAVAIPNAESHVLEDQHHMMPLLAADRVNTVLKEFLETCFR